VRDAPFRSPRSTGIGFSQVQLPAITPFKRAFRAGRMEAARNRPVAVRRVP
jgi:hypothetical protein